MKFRGHPLASRYPIFDRSDREKVQIATLLQVTFLPLFGIATYSPEYFGASVILHMSTDA
ncbi:MAG: hypothetical protein DMG80_14105 [Acidobacteria bacterium]|nr:MAG: hypothetical protein DMG80_14105 [Acidobacteriota bacterium]